MNNKLKIVAQKCLDGAYNNKMSFPEILKILNENGFESYRVDYLQHCVSYYLTNGNGIDLPLPKHEASVAKIFDTTALQSAIKEAQQQLEGYTYKSFCEKVMNAGCAGYIVSFLGKRVLYFGRTAETHIELFPQ
ncbi:DUF1398 family protein [Spirobacillus cienkowskii]|uniref:DUF1398 family protein n=1 Tax=Spirobacillus cienkowskii TaxID=495820 RepID=UPI0030D441A7